MVDILYVDNWYIKQLPQLVSTYSAPGLFATVMIDEPYAVRRRQKKKGLSDASMIALKIPFDKLSSESE